jgi:hypothetical protein
MDKIECLFLVSMLLLLYQRSKKIYKENEVIKSSLHIEDTQKEDFWAWNIPTRSYNYWYDDYFIRYPWMQDKFYNPYYFPYYSYPWYYNNGFQYASQHPIKLIKREFVSNN